MDKILGQPAETHAHPGWVSVRAIAWVIDEAPVPSDLALTLLVIARRADERGRGSRQSVATIASKTGKSEAQVRRDIARLRELRLLLLGDQSLAAHYPAGKRPVVYDLPLKLRGPKPTKESRNKTGKGGTPSMDATPSAHATPGMDATRTPRMDAHGTPSIHATQTKPLNNPENNPSLSARVPDGRPALVEDRERDEDSSNSETQDLRHQFVMHHGATADEAPRVVADIQAEHKPRGNGWWRKVDQEGDLGDLVAQSLTRVRTPAAASQADQPVDPGALIRNAERHGPHCEDHGVPGGKFLHPIHGTPLCAFCRRGLPPRTTRQETMNA